MAKGLSIRWLDALAASALLAIGSLLLVSQYDNLERALSSERTLLLTSVAGRLEASINASLARSEAATRAAAAYVEALPEVDPQRFAVFAEQMLRSQSAMRMLSWEPRVIEGQQEAFEAGWHKRGLTGFRLRDSDGVHLSPARRRPVSYPVLAGHALDAPLPVGLVAATEVSVESPPLAAEAPALQRATLAQAIARDLGEPRATAIYRSTTPMADAGANPAFADLVFALRQPVYAAPPGEALEDRRALLHGFAAATIAIPGLLAGARDTATSQHVAFRVYDLVDDGPLLLYEHHNGEPVFEAQHEFALAVLGRRWRVQLMAPPGSGLSSALLLAQLAAGVGILLLLCAGWLRSRHREQRVVAAQRRLHELTDALPVGVFQCRRHADTVRVSYVNRGAGELLEQDPERLVDAPESLFDFLDADEREALFAGFRRALDEGSASLCRELVASLPGGMRRLQLSAVVRRSGAAAVVDGVIEDVTALRAAGQQLETLADEQAAIIASVPFGLLFAERGQITRANPALAQLLGHLDAEQLIGRPLMSLHGDEADYRQLRKAATIPLRAGKLFSTDWTLVRHDGEAFCARLLGRRLQGSEAARELWVVIESGSATLAGASVPGQPGDGAGP